MPDCQVMVKIVYKKLEEETLYANLETCTFAHREVDYCGFLVGEDRVRPQSEKLTVVIVWPTPTNLTEVRSFLGLCVFTRCLCMVTQQ